MEPVRHLTPRDRLWPEELRRIDAPPEELWLRGAHDVLHAGPRVAVVGSRAPTPYGEGQARRFAARFAEAGVVVVSGLARGIDAGAHAAALDAGGRTLAVLGSGVDRPWPRGALTDRLLREALLLSEFPLGQDPRRHHFPLRNRVISALSLAVVVIEAAHASGSLVTARWAADQGKHVCAVPGRVDHPMARGCHRLIREGATLVESPAEVLAELGLGGDAARAAPESSPEHPILRALSGETLTVDELAERLGRPAGDLLADLIELELSDRVVRAPGGLFRRVVR
jgi:DNA processing protein